MKKIFFKKVALLNFSLGLLSFITFGCSKDMKQPVEQKDTTIKNSPKSEVLLFQTGFQNTQSIVNTPDGNSTLTGTDNSLPLPNNIEERKLSLSTGGSTFLFNYTGGNSTQRFAEIADDPTSTTNKVLHYRIISPWGAETGAEKARVQYEFYNLKSGLKSFSQSVRVYLPQDFNTLRDYPKEIDWLTIAEFWNNITWQQNVPNRFRVTLGIGKATTTPSDLIFIVDGQDCELFADGKQKYTTLWSEKSTQTNVPIGEWFTLKYSYVEGNAQTGRFKMSIIKSSNGTEQEQVVFDITNFTHNSKDLNPDGVTSFNPMKLYTSKELVNFMKEKNKTLDIYWDDLKIYGK